MKKRFLKMFSLVLAVCMLCPILALGTAAEGTLYEDGTYYSIENLYVDGVNVGYIEATYLTRVVVNNISQLQLGTEVRGGPTSSYRTTSETKIYTILVGGKREVVNLSSETEGTRLLSAVVTFTNCDDYVSYHIHGWVDISCTHKTSGIAGEDLQRRWWRNGKWQDPYNLID